MREARTWSARDLRGLLPSDDLDRSFDLLMVVSIASRAGTAQWELLSCGARYSRRAWLLRLCFFATMGRDKMKGRGGWKKCGLNRVRSSLQSAMRAVVEGGIRTGGGRDGRRCGGGGVGGLTRAGFIARTLHDGCQSKGPLTPHLPGKLPFHMLHVSLRYRRRLHFMNIVKWRIRLPGYVISH